MISHSVETPRGTGAFFLSLVSSPPDKGGYFPRAFISFSTPPSFGHLPYMAEPHPVMLRDTAGESLILDFVAVAVFFNPSVLRTPPLYFAAQNTEEEGEMYFPLSLLLRFYM